MQIYIGADHRGFAHKEALKDWLIAKGYDVEDLGAHAVDPNDDYPDIGAAVGRKVAAAPGSLGVLLCGSGAGVSIAANKIPGVRAVVATEPLIARVARNDDDANVLALAADHASEDMVKILTAIFLETPFAGDERYVRRIHKIHALERA